MTNLPPPDPSTRAVEQPAKRTSKRLSDSAIAIYAIGFGVSGFSLLFAFLIFMGQRARNDAHSILRQNQESYTWPLLLLGLAVIAVLVPIMHAVIRDATKSKP